MRASAVAIVTLVLVLSGCSGTASSDPDAAAGSSTAPAGAAPSGPSTPSADAASATPARPDDRPRAVPPPPRGKDDRQGRTAFARYVLQAWIYALNTNDLRPLLRVSGPKPCSGCAELGRELRKRKRQHWHVVLDGVRVGRTKTTSPGATTLARTTVTIPPSDSYFDDGRLRGSNPGHRRSTFEVEMRHTGKGFRLVSFSLY